MSESALIYVADSGHLGFIEYPSLQPLTDVSFTVDQTHDPLCVNDAGYLLVPQSPSYRVFSLGNFEEVFLGMPTSRDYSAIAMHPFLPVIAAVNSDDLFVYDILTNTELFRYDASGSDFTWYGVTFSPDGRFLAIRGDEYEENPEDVWDFHYWATAEIYDTSNWSLVKSRKTEQELMQSNFAFSGDSSLFLFTEKFNDGRIPGFYSTDTWALIEAPANDIVGLTPNGYNKDFAFSKNNQWWAMLIRSYDVPVKIVDVATLSVIVADIPAVTTMCKGLMFSPDDRYLVVYGTYSPYLFVVDTSDWSLVSGVTVPPDRVYGAEFSPDGNILFVSGNFDNIYAYNTGDWAAQPTVIDVGGEHITRMTFYLKSLTKKISGEIYKNGFPVSRQVCVVSREDPPMVFAHTFSSPETGQYQFKFINPIEGTLIVMGDGNEAPDIKRVVAE